MLKIGDTIEFIGTDYKTCISGHWIRHGSTPVRGGRGEIIGKEGEYFVVKYPSTSNGENKFVQLGFRSDQLKLVKSSHNNMSIKESFTLAFKSEPEKSFRQAGITNGDDFLTEDGQHIFLSWLLKKHGGEFKTEVVDGLLADINKKKE